MKQSKTTLLQTSKSKLGRFNPLKAIRKTTDDFKRDKSGVAAIEFALIAPIMIGIYFGLAEIASAINVDRRVSHTANVVGDLATQSSAITNSDINEIFSAAVRVLDLRDASNVTIELSSYDLDPSGNARLLGVATLNDGPNTQNLPPFDASTVDGRILNSSSGVVVARIVYSYTPLMLRYTDADINLTEIFLLKPRRSESVPIGDTAGLPVACSASNFGNVTCGGTVT